MTTAAAESKSAVSWVFDGLVAAAGWSIGLLAVAGLLLRDGGNDRSVLISLLLGVPVIVIMSRFPLVINRHEGSGIEVGFDSAALVFFACFSGTASALVIWTAGQAVSQLSGSKRRDVRAFNVGLGVLAGFAAINVMLWFGPLSTPSGVQLIGVAVGCVVYFATDYLISAISISLEEQSPLLTRLRVAASLAALGIFVAIDSLGYLAWLVVTELPEYASLLLAVPVATILVATRALSRGNEHQRRLGALFEAARAAQAAMSVTELEEVIDHQAKSVVLNSSVSLGSEPPKEQEIGARLTTGSEPRWLVAPAVNRARASMEADRLALEALASVADEAYSRLKLVDAMGTLARHDSLTSLPNRMVFLDRVAEAVARSRRSGRPVAVLFIDLDGFKSVNDRFGHSAGDDLLRTVADRLLVCLRAVDVVARMGGDEFAVLVENVADPVELDLLCRRILSSVGEEVVIAGHDVVVGASIGVAIATDEDDETSLLRNSDMAMYRAKTVGREGFCFYESALREASIRRIELVEALRSGVSSELVVYYQPVVDLRRGRIDGLEALVRWNRDGLLVPPDAFISAAEESGLVVEVGERVLAQIVEDIPLLTDAIGRALNIGCNVSALQLREPGFVDLVAGAANALRRSHNSQLVLEMTESLVITDDPETARVLDAFKALEVLIAIDDFGVGFSSIGYLQHLPVDVVKIDKSFTTDIETSNRSLALVESIIKMCSALDLAVVAEGIEREGQEQRLLRVGCTVGQGFLYGRPQSLTDILRTLRVGLPVGSFNSVAGA